MDSKKKIFLSYAHSDWDVCERIKEELEMRGYDVWFDKDKIRIGDNWRDEIISGIEGAQAMIACLSEKSVRERGVCRDEVRIAINVIYGNIYTILLEDELKVKPPASLCHIQWLDMREWKERREELSEESYNRWIAERIAELIDNIEKKDGNSLKGDIQIIEEKLHPIYDKRRAEELLSVSTVERKWLVQEVDQWLNAKDSERNCIVWGEAGMGKSVFAAQYVHYNDQVAAAIYCDHNKNIYKDAKMVIKALAFLLACRLPQYRKRLLKKLQNDTLNLDEFNEADLFDYLLVEPLNDSVDGGHEPLCMVIDAIDEAGDKNGNVLYEVIANYSDRLPQWLHFLLTSRNVTVIKQLAHEFYSININDEKECIIKDVRSLFEIELATELAQRGDRAEVLDALAQKSDGVFLYSKMIIDSIKKKRMSLDNIHSFPIGLCGSFKDWFERVFPDSTAYEDTYSQLLGYMVVTPYDIPIAEFSRLSDNWTNKKTKRLIEDIEVLISVGIDIFEEKTIRFAHKYISEWLLNEEYSVTFCVDEKDSALELIDAIQEVIDEEEDLTPYEIAVFPELVVKYGKKRQYRQLLANSDFMRLYVGQGADLKQKRVYQRAITVYQLAEKMIRDQEETDRDTDLLLKICMDQADIFMQIGDFLLADQYLQEGCRLAEESNDIKSQLQIRCNMAKMIPAWKNYSPEEIVYASEECLALLENHKSAFSKRDYYLQMFEIKNLMAETYRINAQFELSEKILREIIDQSERCMDVDDAEFLVSLARLIEKYGIVIDYRHDYRQAVDTFQKAVDTYEKAFQSNNNLRDEIKLDYGLAMARMGESYFSLGDTEEIYADGMQMIDRALEIYEEVKEQNPEIVDVYAKIGFACLKAAEKLPITEQYQAMIDGYLTIAFQAVIDGSRKIDRFTESSTKRHFFNIDCHAKWVKGQLCELENNMQEAEKCYLESLEANSFSIKVSPDHPFGYTDRVRALVRFVNYLKKCGRIEEAKEQLENAYMNLKIARQKVGREDAFSNLEELLAPIHII